VTVAKAVLDVASVHVVPMNRTEKCEWLKRSWRRRRGSGDGDARTTGWELNW
jgi:hypothetical protein